MANKHESMHIDPYEKTWIIISIFMLLIFFGAITVAGLSFGVRVPDPVARVNPNDLAASGTFAEPGLKEVAPKRYEAYIRGPDLVLQPPGDRSPCWVHREVLCDF